MKTKRKKLTNKEIFNQYRRKKKVYVHNDLHAVVSGNKLKDFIGLLQEYININPGRQLMIDEDYHYANDACSKLVLYYEDWENEEDTLKRIADDKAKVKQQEEQELKDYERLHKKYGGKRKAAVL